MRATLPVVARSAPAADRPTVEWQAARVARELAAQRRRRRECLGLVHPEDVPDRPRKGGRHRQHDYGVALKLIQEHPRAGATELARLYAEATGREINRKSMWTIVRTHGRKLRRGRIGGAA